MNKNTIALSQEALAYMLTGDLDDACRAIALHTQGIHLSEWLRRHHPMNIESIRRCRLLLETCPEIQSKFDIMTDVSPSWAILVKAWPEICGVMDQECPNWRKTLWANGCWNVVATHKVLRELLSWGNR